MKTKEEDVSESRSRPVAGEVERRSRPAAGDVEQRTAPAAPTIVDGRRLRGTIPLGVLSEDLGGWREQLDPGCLANARLDGLVARVDHAGVPLGRYPTTLECEDTQSEFRWAVDLPESRADVREAVERRDLAGGSWEMVVARDRWDGNVRHVLEVSELRDVSVVTSPAYSASVVEYRSSTPPTPPGPPPRPGGLRVEQRVTGERGTPEQRIIEAMAGVPRGEARALTHATADPVEPDDLRTQLIRFFRERSVVAQAGVPVIPTDSKVVTWPRITGDVDAAFYDELDPITESDPDLDDFTVNVKNIKALVKGSTEAFEDSDPELLGIVNESINEALVLKGDRACLTGDVATEPKGFDGILNIDGVQSIAVNGPLTYDVLLKAAGLLDDALVVGPYRTLARRRALLPLQQLKETGTGAYVMPPEGVPPISTTSFLPIAGTPPRSTVVVFAPMQSMIVVRRQVVIEVDRSEEFSIDAVKVRGRYRLGYGTPHPQSIVLLTGVDSPVIA